MKGIHVLIIFVLMIYGMALNAQSDQQCIRHLLQYNKKMNAISMPEGNNVYYFNYQLTTDMRTDRGMQTKSYNVHLYMTKNQMHYITKDIKIYQDTTDAFIVQHENKTIIMANSAYKKDMNKRYNDMVMFKDSLFNVMQLKQCKYADEKDMEIIVLETKPALRDDFDINSITYHYDPEKELVKKTITRYDEHFKAEKMIMELKTMDLNYKKSMNKPVRTLFLDHNGRLTGRYAGYRLFVNN